MCVCEREREREIEREREWSRHYGAQFLVFAAAKKKKSKIKN